MNTMAKYFYVTDYETGEIVCDLIAWWNANGNVIIQPSEPFEDIMRRED